MEMTKEELQRRVNELTTDIAKFESDSEHCKRMLTDMQQRISVIDKPKVTQKFLDELSDAIEEAVRNIDFDDTNAYEYEFNLDYDNRISLENIEFNYSNDIGDNIYSEIEELFNVIEDENEA